MLASAVCAALVSSFGGSPSRRKNRYRLSTGGNRIRTIGLSCERLFWASPIGDGGTKGGVTYRFSPRRQCLPGVAADSLSVRGGTASSNPSSSSEESIANLTFGGSSAAGGDVSGTKGQHMLDQGGPDVLMSKRSSRSRRYRSRQRRGCSSTHRLPAVAFEVARGPSSLACGIYSHIDAI